MTRCSASCVRRASAPKRSSTCWDVTHERPALALLDVDPAQQRGFLSLLFLAQALGKQNATDPLEIVVVSNHLHEVTGGEALCPRRPPCSVRLSYSAGVPQRRLPQRRHPASGRALREHPAAG